MTDLPARYPVLVGRFTEGRVPLYSVGQMTAAQLARDVADDFRYAMVAPDTIKVLSDVGQVIGIASVAPAPGKTRADYRDNEPIPFFYVPIRYPGMKASDQELADALATLLCH